MTEAQHPVSPWQIAFERAVCIAAGTACALVMVTYLVLLVREHLEGHA